MKKSLLLISLFCVLFPGINAQNFNKKELAVSFGPTISRIKNKNISNDKYKSIDDKNGFNLDICFNKYFIEGAGFGIGLGYSTYNQTIYQKGLIENFSQTDKDGNLYDEWFDSDMTYTNKIQTLDVPVNFHFLLGNSDKFEAVFDIGVINQFLIVGDYAEKGSIENMGKYASPNPYFSYISQNNSYYNYHVEFYDKKYNDRYNFYNLSGHFSAGLAVRMSDNLFFKAQAYFNAGFTDATAKEFRGLDYENIQGYKEDYQKTKLFAAGLNVGFVFRLGN